jgi:deferrochelatase/peroxidase EfeB
MAMNDANAVEFYDLQGLLRFGHGKLTETCFLLLNIKDANAAKHWLNTAPVTSAVQTSPQPDKALHIAFSVQGLRIMGLKEAVIESFSDEFIIGLSGDESRSRRLGDVGANAPKHWSWGGDAHQIPHIVLLLYAEKGGLPAWRATVENNDFLSAFQVLSQLPTLDSGQIEPFGFVDGISQPSIDWARQQSMDAHDRGRYSNLVAIGEVVLGYPNEYGQYTTRPLIDPVKDPRATVLPDAEDAPVLKDLGRNGTYLVVRQLGQDVTGFWRTLDRLADANPEKREQLAAAMVGRTRAGLPLLPAAVEHIPGISDDDQRNRFNYDDDPGGKQCPIGAHIRRANPRTGDLPPGVTGFMSRLFKILGFGQRHPNEDLVASTRFHRLLRRGRSYGPVLTPEDAIKADAPAFERGLQFICLVANLSRQFEFVQNAWIMSSKFGGVQQESDPLLGNRQPLMSGESTDQFNRPDPTGPVQKTCPLPQFITVRGGGYFFMPGLRALKYLAALPSNGSDKVS